MPQPRIAFAANPTSKAQAVLTSLTDRYKNVALDEAEVIVALGGDGFMLRTLHSVLKLGVPVYGMNAGSLGFLMNEYEEDGLLERIAEAELVELHPLRMRAHCVNGTVTEALAINEVSLLRQTYQAAKLGIRAWPNWYATACWSPRPQAAPPITCRHTAPSCRSIPTSCA